MKYQVLLADDEATFRDTFAAVLREEGLSVTAVANGTDALEAIKTDSYAVALLDIRMPGADGIKVLREITKTQPETQVIMITAYGTVEMAVEAMKLGASDYVMKPVIFDDILAKIHQQLEFRQLQTQNRQLQDELREGFGLQNLVGQSQAMESVFDTIRKVAETKSNVLIVGESGTGKELVARAVHALGVAKAGRFVGVNCSAIPEQLLESELFGHVKGSFTSAVQDKKGLFEIADGGTLFLDEIGHMPISCQVKLLRAIEERNILPVGSTDPVDFDVHLISAMNRDPLDEIKAERFREDLYYRLNVVGIYLPPLRDRREDIPLLVDHFINKYNTQMGKNYVGVSEEALSILMDYEWKGNIRELQNIIERAVIFADGDTLGAQDIGLVGPAIVSFSRANENLQSFLKACEKEHLCRILDKYDCDKGVTATALGVGLSSLYRKIEQLGIGFDSGSARPKERKAKDATTAPAEDDNAKKLSAG